MLPVKQTILQQHNPDGSVAKHGNCFRACLASLMEVSIDSIPACEQTTSANEFWNGFSDYLESVGLEMKFWRPWDQPIGYSIISGRSPRSPLLNHSCIAHNGKPVFDPHPDGTFITTICDYITLEPITRGTL